MVGIQLYSVRDSTEHGLPETLSRLRQMGYGAVEFAGFFGHGAQAVKAMLDENGLAVWGAHVLVKDMADEDALFAYHKAIGNHRLVIPWHDLSTDAAISDFAGHVSALIPRAQAHGLSVVYHNHADELLANKDGTVPLDRLLEIEGLGIELDTYWAYVAGQDPVETMRRLAGKLALIHIKDGDSAGNGQPLGRGTAPIRAVYDEARRLNVPLIVESETLSPSGLAEAQLCIDTIKDMGA